MHKPVSPCLSYSDCGQSRGLLCGLFNLVPGWGELVPPQTGIGFGFVAPSSSWKPQVPPEVSVYEILNV